MKIILKGNPVSTNNIYRYTKYGTYMTEKGKSLKNDYYYQLKNQYKSTPCLDDVILAVELFFGDKRIRDIDNYNKIVLDACSGILWIDDSQIQEIKIKKNYDKDNPRIELIL